MGITTGLHGKDRFQVLKQHRMDWYFKALDELLRGESTPEYVAERARKCDQILRRYH